MFDFSAHLIKKIASGDIGEGQEVSHAKILVRSEDNGKWYMLGAHQIPWRGYESPSLIDALDSDEEDLIFDVADWYANGISFKEIADDNPEATLAWLARAHAELLTKKKEWEEDCAVPISQIISRMLADLEGTDHRNILLQLQEFERAWATIQGGSTDEV